MHVFTFFRHSLVFAIFQPLPVDFGSQEEPSCFLQYILGRQSKIFDVYMQQLAAALDTSTPKFPAFFLFFFVLFLFLFFFIFQLEDRVLKVKKSKITGRKTFNGENFDIDGNHGSCKDGRTLFQVFLEIFDHCFNTQATKYVYLPFLSIVWFFISSGHFLQVLEATKKLIFF